MPVLGSAGGLKEFMETELWLECKKASHSENAGYFSVCVPLSPELFINVMWVVIFYGQISMG